jgi:D-methionine transport system ATP-binding protein
LDIQGLTKRFGEGAPVLRGIDLSVSKGEIFGVIGKSGVGKSTLVRCINLLEPPSSGRILFAGRDLLQLRRAELYKTRQSMGFIFQQFNLLMQRTALANVLFPMEIAHQNKRVAKARAMELLDMVGLADRAQSYPAQLSGGQRQRVAIARAIALNPVMLLCDEATSALDPETTRGILSLLTDINRQFGITIMLITHEMQVIESICQRVAILEDGLVAEDGIVADIFANPKSLAAKALLFPGGENAALFAQKNNLYRITFDGNSSFEPVIADLVLRFHQRVNILYADTKDVGGQAFGEMILQLPEDTNVAAHMADYLRNHGISAEEVRDDV